MRTGVLSDESIIKHCSRHRPIPMGISKSILQPTLHDTTPYSSKKLKYIKQMSRPKDFDVLATQLTRNSGGHAEIRERLHQAFHNEIHGDIVIPAAPAATAEPMTPSVTTEVNVSESPPLELYSPLLPGYAVKRPSTPVSLPTDESRRQEQTPAQKVSPIGKFDLSGIEIDQSSGQPSTSALRLPNLPSGVTREEILRRSHRDRNPVERFSPQ